MINASRQVWLASLGAAVVTRDWAQSEAGNVFRTLVKEGTLVESRTIRMVGDRLEGSIAMANAMWKRRAARCGDRAPGRRHRGDARAEQPAEVTLPKVDAAGDARAKAKPAKKRAAKPGTQGREARASASRAAKARTTK